MSLSLAELGEISKSYAYEDVEKVRVPGWGHATGAAGRVRGAADDAYRRVGQKIGEKATRGVRDKTARIQAGIDDAMEESGSKFGNAIGNQAGARIEEKVDRATNRAVRRSIIGGGALLAGGGLTYDVTRRREHARRKKLLEEV